MNWGLLLAGVGAIALILAAGWAYGEAKEESGYEQGTADEREAWLLKKIATRDALLQANADTQAARDAKIDAHFRSLHTTLEKRGALTQEVKAHAAANPSPAACLLDDDGMRLAGRIIGDTNAAVSETASRIAGATGRAAADPAGVHD